MTFESLLIHSIYKSTQTSSQNDLGEWLYTYTTGTTAISCRVNPLSNAERLDPSGWFSDVRYNIYMDESESISAGDRITYSSEEYDVKDCVTDSSSHNKKASVRLIT